MSVTPDSGFHTSFSMEGDAIHPVGPEGPLKGLRDSMKWQDAWMMAIAIAWSNEALQQELIQEPRKFFKERCDFDLPPGLTFKVITTPEKDSEGNRTGWDPEKKLWYLKNTEVTMYLPPAPALQDQAVALSAYLATGRTYPFTLC